LTSCVACETSATASDDTSHSAAGALGGMTFSQSAGSMIFPEAFGAGGKCDDVAVEDLLEDQLASIVVRHLCKRFDGDTLQIIADGLLWTPAERLSSITAQRYRISAVCDPRTLNFWHGNTLPPVSLQCTTAAFSDEAVMAALRNGSSAQRKALVGAGTASFALKKFRQAVERLAVSDAGTNATPDAREALLCMEHASLLTPHWLATLMPSTVGGALWPRAASTLSSASSSSDVRAAQHELIRRRFFDGAWFRPDWPPVVLFGAVRGMFSSDSDEIDVPGPSHFAAMLAAQLTGTSDRSSSTSSSHEPPVHHNNSSVAGGAGGGSARQATMSAAAARALASRRGILIDATSVIMALRARTRAITSWVGAQASGQGNGGGGNLGSPTTAPPLFPSVLDTVYGDGGRRRLNAATVEAAMAASPVTETPFSAQGLYSAGSWQRRKGGGTPATARCRRA
jgi:hypothetical protein